MKQFAKRPLIRGCKTLIYGIVGAFLMILAVGIYVLNSKPKLEIWHTAKLESEFTRKSPVESFEAYLELEEALFAELDEKVYGHIDPEDREPINRYHRDSLSDPTRWTPNWNRSFELAADGEPAAAVLLLHGLSDSPYSLRNIGEQLHSRGAHVLGLRIPGHGTAPSGLTRTTWQDMAAAVAIAVRHLRENSGGQPLYVIGYSNGGALAVNYALSSLEDSDLPKVDGMVLISPEIGITPMAGLAIWQERIGRVLGLKKLAWSGVSPEYDPFKYCSFPVNAGNLAYKLTGVNRSNLSRLSKAKKLDAFPPVIAFQSAVDATVSAPALVQDLFSKLPENRHELVIFGINRTVEIEPLLKEDPKPGVRKICDLPDRAFTFSVVVNADDESEQIVLKSWEPGQSTPAESKLELVWPDSIYSLAHVALPFSEDDPVYGGNPTEESPGIQLGNVALRGEKGVIHIPAGDMLRLRWNPFYPFMEERILERLNLKTP